MPFPNLITYWNFTHIVLCAELAQAPYHKKVSKYVDQIYYSKETAAPYEPVFYIASKGDSLFIIVRGSWCPDDDITDYDYKSINTPYGTFHTGFYKAATYILQFAKSYIQTWKGPVYCVGHSMGASVATIITAICTKEIPDADVNGIVIAAAPCMDISTFEKNGKIATFVSGDDLFPTLSIENGYESFKKDFPPPGEPVDRQKLIDKFHKYLKIIKPFKNATVYNLLYEKSEEVVDDLIRVHNGEHIPVRYVAGNAYHVHGTKRRYLSECLEDQTVTLNSVHFSVSGLINHDGTLYVEAIKLQKGV